MSAKAPAIVVPFQILVSIALVQLKPATPLTVHGQPAPIFDQALAVPALKRYFRLFEFIDL